MATQSELFALSFENNKLTSMLRTHNVRLKIKAAVPEPGISPFVRLLLGGRSGASF